MPICRASVLSRGARLNRPWKKASPHTKGDSVGSSYKEAVCQGGVRIMVPPFVERGERVVVDTRDGTFVKRT